MSANIYFQELDKSIASEKLKQIEFKVKQEIFSSLPTLNEQEKDSFKKIHLEVGLKKERLRIFYDYIKKKYPNFIELSFINEDMFYDFYHLESLTSSMIEKISIRDVKQPFKTYLQKSIFRIEDEESMEIISENKDDSENRDRDKTVKTDLTKFNNYFSSDNKGSSFNFSFPSNISLLNINEDLILNDTINKIVKYDPRLNNKAIAININYFYSNLEKDIFSFINSKTSITHLILNFNSEKIFDEFTKKFDTLRNLDFNQRANRVLGVILTQIQEYYKRSLFCLIINFNNCNFNVFDYIYRMKEFEANKNNYKNSHKDIHDTQDIVGSYSDHKIFGFPFVLNKENLVLIEDIISGKILTLISLKNICLSQYSKEFINVIQNSLSLEVFDYSFYNDLNFDLLKDKETDGNKESKEIVENDSKNEEEKNIDNKNSVIIDSLLKLDDKELLDLEINYLTNYSNNMFLSEENNNIDDVVYNDNNNNEVLCFLIKKLYSDNSRIIKVISGDKDKCCFTNQEKEFIIKAINNEKEFCSKLNSSLEGNISSSNERRKNNIALIKLLSSIELKEK